MTANKDITFINDTGVLFTITAEGKIEFSSHIKNVNTNEQAKAFIKILEDLFYYDFIEKAWKLRSDVTRTI